MQIINVVTNLIPGKGEHQGKYLLMQQKEEEFSEKWDFPGGKPNSRESFLKCATRKGKEITGYDLEIIGWLGWHHQLEWPALGGHGLIINVFLSEIVDGEKIVPGDVFDVGWFTEDEIMNMAHNGELSHPYVINSIMTLAGQVIIDSLATQRPGKPIIYLPSDHFKTYGSSA